MKDIHEKKKGISRYLCIKCSSDFVRHWYSSKATQSPNKVGMKFFDVNIRMVCGMRALGGGYAALQKLCGYLNMQEPMTENNFDKLSNTIKTATKEIADMSMRNAAKEIQDETKDITDVAVSVDGSWQKRGFSSLNGVVTAISIKSGKVLDTEILNRNCKSCNLMEKIQKTDYKCYDTWRASHICSLNYEGSAPNMERVGAVNIFERSIMKHSLRYTAFYGDGDCKSFKAVEKVYGDNYPVVKYECIGHYQKRLGNRLRKLRKVKNLGGKNRLVNKKIDTLQNYFGIALRDNVGNLDAMTTAIMASMYHVSDYHADCPKTSDTWCQYQSDKINGTKH